MGPWLTLTRTSWKGEGPGSPQTPLREGLVQLGEDMSDD